jgi:hydroxymethylglutaryl-CoA reductase (NADPH)
VINGHILFRVRWPRKNDAASIRARQEALGINGLVTSIELEPFTAAAETVTGVAVIPVSVVPVAIDLGEYALDDAGDVAETGRATETVHVPLAHTEGGLTASMTRGAKAAGTIHTHVLHDRITRASCFVCASAAEAIALAQWLERELDAMRAWLTASQDPFVSHHAKLREVKTHVVGPMCHVLWAWTTGDAVGPNMMTRNSYLLNMGYVMDRAPVKPERAVLEANMGGDKKPSYEYFHSGHGKTVIAECTLTDEAIARILRTTPEDLEALAWAGTHGAVASGMQSVAFTPASAIAAVFTATGQDIGMVGTSSMAHGTGRRVDGGFHCSIRFPGLEVGTVGGGTTLPSARDWLGAMGCSGPGKVYRFAQAVAAAALALEISASAAMATAGSENFFRAHHERGGLR